MPATRNVSRPRRVKGKHPVESAAPPKHLRRLTLHLKSKYLVALGKKKEKNECSLLLFFFNVKYVSQLKNTLFYSNYNIYDPSVYRLLILTSPLTHVAQRACQTVSRPQYHTVLKNDRIVFRAADRSRSTRWRPILCTSSSLPRPQAGEKIYRA